MPEVIDRSFNLGDFLTSSTLQGKLGLVVGTLLLGCYPIIGTSTVILDIPSTPVSISYRAVYLLLSIYVLVVELPKISYRRIPLGVVLLSAFWVAYSLRLLYDFYVVNLDRGYARKGVLYFFQYGLGGCFIPALMVGLIQDRIDFIKLRKWVRRAFVFSCVFILVYIYVTIGLNITIFYRRIELGEDSVIGPILMSQIGGGLLVLTVMEKLLYRNGNIWVLLQGALGVVILIMGGSRGPVVSTIFVIVLLAFQSFKWSYLSLNYWSRIIAGLVVLSAAVVTYVVPNIKSFVLFNRINQTIGKGAGLDERNMQWTAAWNQFLRSPVVGDQIIEDAFWFYPHNFILEVLMSTGVIGGFFVLTLLVLWAYKFINRQAIPLEKWWVLYFMIVFFGYAFFSQPLVNQTHLWVLLTLGACIPLYQRKQTE